MGVLELFADFVLLVDGFFAFAFFGVVEGFLWEGGGDFFSFEPQNQCFRRFLGQKSSTHLFRTAKSMFSTIFGSKIEYVPHSNRKIDVFEDF